MISGLIEKAKTWHFELKNGEKIEIGQKGVTLRRSSWPNMFYENGHRKRLGLRVDDFLDLTCHLDPGRRINIHHLPDSHRQRVPRAMTEYQDGDKLG